MKGIDSKGANSVAALDRPVGLHGQAQPAAIALGRQDTPPGTPHGS